MSIKIRRQDNIPKSLGRLTALAGTVAFASVWTPMQNVSAITLPDGFAEVQYATGLTNPTAMAFAPDPCPGSGTPVHRLFVCEQAGTVRVFRNGVLQPAPLAALDLQRSLPFG